MGQWRPASVLLLLVICSFFATSHGATFKCKTAGAKCRALIDYLPPNSTTLSSIKTLFDLKNIRTILGANGLPLSTPSTHNLTKLQPIKIPFPCICTLNGTGVSAGTPTYTVQPDDGLYHIAADVFSNLVTYPEIAAANNISDVNLIEVGQELWIPLPCSCDPVGGAPVVHYGYNVPAGSSLEGIAAEYGTTEGTLMEVNGIANATSLQAGQVIDVPLQACNSSVRSDSLDYPLLVSNGTYVFTANNCVKCTCSSSSNWTLQCEPSGLKPSNWSSCPVMQCAGAGSLYLSNTTTSSCNSTTCAYAGYTNQTILTTLLSTSTCPSSGNYASTLELSWKLCIHGGGRLLHVFPLARPDHLDILLL